MRPHLCLFAAICAVGAGADTITLSVAAGPTDGFRDVSPTLYSAFVEDINHAVTGGLSAEMIPDPQCRGPWLLEDAPPHSSRISLEAVDFPGLFIRECDGVFINQEGGILQTFHAILPLDSAACPPGSTLGAPSSPNTIACLALQSIDPTGKPPAYLVANTDGRSLKIAVDDGSGTFAARASWVLQPVGVNAAYAITNLGFPGTAITIGAEQTSGGCTWIGTRFALGLAPSSPSASQQFIVTPPQCPSATSWITAPVPGVTLSANFTNSTLLPSLSPAVPSAIRIVTIGHEVPVYLGPGVCNVGFFGALPLQAGLEYSASFYAMADPGFPATFLTLTLETANGTVLDAVNRSLDGAPPGTWAQYSDVRLRTTQTVDGRFCLRAAPPTFVIFRVSITSVSLTQVATFANRGARGMRNDVAQRVAALQPAIVRFPGGTYILGTNRSDFYNFTTTIGVAGTDRPSHYDLWGYQSTDYAGFYEWMQFIEDIGATPLFVANAGLFNDGSSVTGAALQPFIDHALAALEFANADPAINVWAAKRAAMGHPAPFDMRYLAIGNENSGNTYRDNYAAMYAAIKAAWPNVTLVANSNLAGVPVDLYDYHNYWSFEQMVAGQYMWDAYNRSSPKVFNSEYATKPSGRGNLLGALGDAVWLTGLERNSDVVTVAAYAPLLFHQRDVAWLPNAIGFDGRSSYGIPSYHVQRLFRNHTSGANTLLPFNATSSNSVQCAAAGGVGGPVCEGDLQTRFNVPINVSAANFSATVSAINASALGPVVIKLVNTDAAARSLVLVLSGRSQPASCVAERWVISGSALDAENSVAAPDNVVPLYDTVSCAPGARITLAGYSVTLLRVT